MDRRTTYQTPRVDQDKSSGTRGCWTVLLLTGQRYHMKDGEERSSAHCCFSNSFSHAHFGGRRMFEPHRTNTISVRDPMLQATHERDIPTRANVGHEE
ncbi:hypothetical protein EYF80_045378 [Liparis tanakae]|uniref:Uncharacterized protein n=1 Tax=Liparis tanakae TaxID=230148 RepID=A0A4Z2FUS8_9TELE|nr:hypothetical protein EYF80_045378 [Liparis tanakae]